MRLHKIAAVILVISLTTPAFAARNGDTPNLYERIARILQRVVLRVIAPNGNGLIPPIP